MGRLDDENVYGTLAIVDSQGGCNFKDKLIWSFCLIVMWPIGFINFWKTIWGKP